jgi:hypothetical protein
MTTMKTPFPEKLHDTSNEARRINSIITTAKRETLREVKKIYDGIYYQGGGAEALKAEQFNARINHLESELTV